LITHIKTKNFKGSSLDEDIGQKTIFLGENESGKSTRGAAIALTILGFIPFSSKPTKTASTILDDFGNGKELTTAVICDGVEFERRFRRSEKGTVSQLLRVDKKKYSKGDFEVELYKAGAPNIIDINDFVNSSEQKKIDTLFSLYPLSTDLKKLDSDIEKSKKNISNLEASNRTATGVIQRLNADKAEIELPAGSLAETKTEIEKLTQKVNEARENLKQAEIKDAQETAKEEQKKDSQAEFNKIMADNTVSSPKDTKKAENIPVSEKSNIDNHQISQGDYDFTNQKLTSFNPAKSIQRILDALTDSGCQICAAAMVAKVELKKYKEAQNA